LYAVIFEETLYDVKSCFMKGYAVSSEFGGSDDPKRSLALLWGVKGAPKRGPRQSLTLTRIGEVAIALADQEGLGALSMRRVAAALEVSAMSLYTYVASKAELLNVMLDCAYGTLPARKNGGDWRKALEQLAKDSMALYVRHPWMLQVGTHRPVLGPHAIAKYERELGAMAATGLDDLGMDLIVSLVADYVRGAANSAVDAAAAPANSGQSDAQWWQAHQEAFDSVFDAAKFPLAARVGAAAGQAYASAHDPQRSFEFGLKRVLDGIEAHVRDQLR
jgi:AcrR family transcriptional regulator